MGNTYDEDIYDEKIAAESKRKAIAVTNDFLQNTVKPVLCRKSSRDVMKQSKS